MAKLVATLDFLASSPAEHWKVYVLYHHVHDHGRDHEVQRVGGVGGSEESGRRSS
jgi:hypothetical protein